MAIHHYLVFFFDARRPDHLYVGTCDQVDHLREVERGDPRRVQPNRICLDGATGRVSFWYRDHGANDETLIENVAFSIAPPSWATGGSPLEREWDAAGPDATAKSIMLGRKPTTNPA